MTTSIRLAQAMLVLIFVTLLSVCAVAQQPRSEKDAKVLGSAMRFVRALHGDKSAEELYPEKSWQTPSFDKRKGLWSVWFGAPFPDAYTVVSMDESATRAALFCHSQVFLYDPNPRKLRTLAEFRAALAADRAKVRKAIAAETK